MKCEVWIKGKKRNVKVYWKYEKRTIKNKFKNKNTGEIETKTVVQNEEFTFGYSHNRATHCIAIDLDTRDIIRQSTAICMESDNFNKAIGRYISFKKLLNILPHEYKKSLMVQFNKEIVKPIKIPSHMYITITKIIDNYFKEEIDNIKSGSIIHNKIIL